MSKFKFLVYLMSIVIFLSSAFSSPVNAQEVEMKSFDYYEDLGVKILKAYNYDENSGNYTFDKELAKQEANLTDEQVNRVEQHLKTLDQNKLKLLQENKIMSENQNDGSSDGTSTRAVQLLPLIGAAALAIVAAVGTTVASAFAEDIYNYGMTTACQNFKKYGAIENFCKINDYI